MAAASGFRLEDTETGLSSGGSPLGIVKALRFSCVSGCTACCEQKGVVYVSEQDILNASRFLGITPAEFEANYVYRTRHQIRLRTPARSACFFLAEGRCTIHPAKPAQCRLFPFWPELVENRAAWKAAGSFCPGIGHGKLIQIGTAMEVADEMRTVFPQLYGLPDSSGLPSKE